MPRSLLALLVLAALVPQAAAQEFARSHLEAAEALLVQTNAERMLTTSINGMLAAQVEQNPDLAPFEDVMRSFFKEHLSWEALREEMVQLYAAAFTEDELRELISFYETEVGQKAITLMPTLMTQGMEMGQRRVQAHLPDLMRRVEERARKLGMR